ncbi:hypothetical protein [Actinophytocola gossypii]|uniref:Uncharacterized protein n=1 Tax=Actinophytocola gossypii TaxID=2812003 RepID=A0ABT2JFG7_9PSEU|nr:hypothetical protein [Actinophytocola gossypii]MCT2586622.1 hypothetical protein [Actinophytocola gossypii]
MDLNDELRQLFADERLDIPVRPGAEATIVAGARRIRRNRRLAVTAGAVAVAVLVSGGVALATHSTNRSLPPAETTADAPIVTPTTSTATTTSRPPATSTSAVTSHSSPPSVESDPPPTGEKKERERKDVPPSLTDAVLTHTGYGPFELGMSGDDALATDLLTLEWGEFDCSRYLIRGGGTVVVSEKFGVVSLRVPERVRTPEGIGAGDTVGEVRATYPGVSDYRHGVSGSATEGTDAFYSFLTVEEPPLHEPVPDTFVVAELRLDSSKSDCMLAM